MGDMWGIKGRYKEKMNVGSRGDRGITAGGQTPSNSDVIDYVNISSTGDAVDFGNLSAGRRNCKAATASPTRAVVGGGWISGNSDVGVNIMEYVTIGSTGNGTDFGDLVNGNRAYVGGGSNSIRGVCFGGDPANTHMEYITIASAGDSTDFGDLSLARVAASGASDSHGGLQA